IGGGPAGMTAALYAQLRGHKVTRYEREKELGGQMVLGVKPPHKDEMQEFLDWQIYQLETLGVTIVLGKDVTTDFVQSQSPEVVIVATGAVPATLSIPGIDSEGVYGFQDILNGTTTPAGAVVVIGGGRVGAETAEFIAEKGGKVTLIEQLPVICPDMGTSARYVTCEALKDLGVVMLPGSKAVKIVKEGVIIADSSGERLLKADAVVLAVGFHPERKILEELIEADFYKVRAAGDCIEPKSILRAVHEGAHTALQI
ncbi:MAG: FAD-dependent oxidoreductase, partial [Theionarchaea archaeon]|nr:FAD-dependent oxidoreductase [Theionarchaea archaeon]